MQIVRLLMLGIVSLTMLSGCASYFVDRGLDIADIGGIKVSAGPQGGFNLRASKVLQLGLMWSQSEVARWQGRRLSIYEENRFEGGVGFIYFLHNETSTVMGNDFHYTYDQYDDQTETWDLERNFDRGFYEIGGSIYFIFAGFDVHVDAFQIADLLAGIFYLDPARDDTRNRDRRPVTGPPVEGYEELIEETKPDEE